MGLASSLIFIWPGTAASIPAGWERETALDDLYPVIVTPEDGPGSLDGVSEHLHIIGGGTHTVNGEESVYASTPNPNGTKSAAATHGHTHAIQTVRASTNNSGWAANNPRHIDVIFIRPADGSRSGVPPGAWSLHADPASLADWSMPSAPKDVLIRGAVGDSLLTATGSNDPHTHTAAHTHWAKNSSLPSAASGAVYATGTGATEAATGTHVHSVSWGSFDPGMGTAASEPGWQKFGVVQNDASIERLAHGTIAFYLGTQEDIPADWALIEMTNFYGFVKGAADGGEVGDTGGDITFDHTHEGVEHADEDGSHNPQHGGFANQANAVCGTTGSGTARASGSHQHYWFLGPATSTIGPPSDGGVYLTGVYPPCIYTLLLEYQGLVVDLGAADATAEAPAVSIYAPTSITLGVTTSTATAPSIEVLAPLDVGVTLDCAGGTAAAPAIGVVAPIVRDLSAAPATAAAPDIVVSPDPAELTLGLASVSSTAPDLVVDGSSHITLGLAKATAEAPAIEVFRSIGIDLRPASAAASAPDLVVVPDPTALTLGLASGTASAPDLAVDARSNLVLTPAAATASAPDLVVVPDPSTLTLGLATAGAEAPSIFARLPDVFIIDPRRKNVPLIEHRVPSMLWEDRYFIVPKEDTPMTADRRAQIAAERRNSYLGICGYGPPTRFFVKDPDSTLDYGVDWAGELKPGDEIESSRWTISPPAQMMSNEEDFGPDAAVIWLSGGTDGSLYRVRNKITTAAGMVLRACFDIRIANR